MKYEWLQNKDDFPVDAQVAGEALAQIESANGGRVSPEVVVEAARPAESPIHNCFTWNDGKAAELWRRGEAAKLIRSVRVVQYEKRYEAPREVAVRPPAIPTAAYVPAKDEAGEHFKRAPVVTRGDQLRTAINTALDNLTAAREKLQPFSEVGKWCEGIKGCEADVKAIREAAAKVCAELERIEDGLVEELMPKRPQPIHDERRLAAV